MLYLVFLLMLGMVREISGVTFISDFQSTLFSLSYIMLRNFSGQGSDESHHVLLAEGRSASPI
jgi:hypothetical protein